MDLQPAGGGSGVVVLLDGLAVHTAPLQNLHLVIFGDVPEAVVQLGEDNRAPGRPARLPASR